ncbi:MAG: cysteine--tRNA ligase, partial [Mesorhizobium sp.]
GDFVLWKLSSPEEPGWDSPWGRGRPGWHIECSAMSAAYLGEVFDIHGGGLDLIFPHHENEIAQSRCAHGTDVMAKVWMHNGFLQVEGQKMSKSLGNFYSINELLETETFGGRKWPGEVLRLAMLMTHYREPIDFSVRKLEEAENTLRKWKRAADLAPAAAKQLPVEVVEALSDDLATYSAFQVLTQLAGEAVDFNGGGNAAAAGNDAAASLKAALLFLGFDVAPAKVDEDAIAKAITKRLTLIAAGNWADADRIRDELLAQGIQLKDGKDSVTSARITTWEVKR